MFKLHPGCTLCLLWISTIRINIVYLDQILVQNWNCGNPCFFKLTMYEMMMFCGNTAEWQIRISQQQVLNYFLKPRLTNFLYYATLKLWNIHQCQITEEISLLKFLEDGDQRSSDMWGHVGLERHVSRYFLFLNLFFLLISLWLLVLMFFKFLSSLCNKP